VKAIEVTFGALILYFIIVLILGFIVEKYVKTLADYILGGRRVGPYVTAFSERASEMSGWVALGLPSEGYSSGLNATWNTIGCFYADLMNWTVLSKKMRRFTEKVGALTVPEYYEFRLADKSGVLRITSALIILVFLTAYVGAQATASGKVFSSIMAAGGATPSASQLKLWITVGGLVMIIYTMLGGYFAVAWTDFIQGLWALIGFISAVSVAASKLGSPLKTLSHTPISPGSPITYTDIHNFWGYHYTGALLLVIILSYIAIGFGWPGNPHITVRYMAIKSTRVIPRSALTALGLLLVIYYLAISAGWYTHVAVLKGTLRADLLQLIKKDTEYSFPALTLNYLHPFAAGLILAAPIALMMSTADSQLLVATSAIIEDLYRRTVKREIEERKLVMWGRIVTFLLGLAALAWALLFEKSVYYFVLFSWGGLGAALGSVTLLTVLDKKESASGAFAGLIAGAAGVIIWKSYVKGYIFAPNGNYNAALGELAASVPVIVFVLSLIGIYLIERNWSKTIIGSVVATVVSAVFWIPWVYIRYYIDPKFTGWWYELLISFPMAIAVILATSRVTTPPPEDQLEEILRNFYEPAPSELEEEGSAGGAKQAKPIAATELEVVKAYLHITGRI
jgi:sodium/proline symporter